MLLSASPQIEQVAAAPQPRLLGSTAMWVGPKSKKELAVEFRVHRHTITEWCRAIGITGGKKLSLGQVMDFYRHYGWPGQYQVQLGFE